MSAVSAPVFWIVIVQSSSAPAKNVPGGLHAMSRWRSGRPVDGIVAIDGAAPICSATSGVPNSGA